MSRGSRSSEQGRLVHIAINVDSRSDQLKRMEIYSRREAGHTGAAAICLRTRLLREREHVDVVDKLVTW
jgi:hypothetical protein